MESHTDDLRNVNQGDSVTFETTDGETLHGFCDERTTHRASEESGEVRKTTLWTFMFDDISGEVSCTITDGLKSWPPDGDFPQYTELWDCKEQETLGYISNVQIHSIAQS